MNEIIKLDNITFEKFKSDNKDHLLVAKSFKSDELINEYFSEWEQITMLSLDDETNTFYSYVAKVNEEYVGICTITFNNDTEVTYSHGLLKNFRGKNIASLMRESMRAYLFSNGVNTIKSYVRNTNQSCVNNHSKNGEYLSEVPNTDLLEIRYENVLTPKK